MCGVEASVLGYWFGKRINLCWDHGDQLRKQEPFTFGNPFVRFSQGWKQARILRLAKRQSSTRQGALGGQNRCSHRGPPAERVFEHQTKLVSAIWENDSFKLRGNFDVNGDNGVDLMRERSANSQSERETMLKGTGSD